MPERERDFESAVDAVYPALVRSARILCGSSSDVEDVVQETLLRAYRSYGSFKGDSSLLTWCYAILARVAADTNRKRWRHVPAGYGRRGADQLPPVDGELIAQDEARRLINAIRALPRRQREVITLHFIEELSYGEIADSLCVAVGTVKATIFAAKMSLRRALSAGSAKPR